MQPAILPATPTPRLSEVVARFLRVAEVEGRLAPQSRVKYEECLRHVGRILGDRPVSEYGAEDILNLKADLLARGLSISRQVSMLSAVKGLLEFSTRSLGLTVLAPEAISIPKRPRRVNV